jgi:tryptophanyl-tRNA synthetase
MPRILTGIQSSGKPHLGNVLAAIQPALQLSAQHAEPSFFFIADLHSLTSRRDPAALREHTLHIAATWLACGLDPEKEIFYRQSMVTEVAELTWYLNCFTPYPMLANAHSFKDKQQNRAEVNAGLFTYPVLMAADILLYDAEVVPVGKDQKQHLEMTRDIANSFNVACGETFVLPEPHFVENVMTLPGTDGRKMSKSYGNTINLFQGNKKLRKEVMQIVTDSTPIEEPKDPDACNVFALYKTVANEDEVAWLRQQYEARNIGFGYGHAKQALYDKLVARFAEERARFDHLINNPEEVYAALRRGEERARQVARPVLRRVRERLGFSVEQFERAER